MATQAQDTTRDPMDRFWHDTLAEADPEIHNAIRN